jgi:hypothetical protein
MTTYTLYIKAISSPQMQTALLLRTSPWAIMEQFTGLNTALNAPSWTSWTRKTWKFQQPKLNFASLFVRMADWEENKVEVCLGYLLAPSSTLTNFL